MAEALSGEAAPARRGFCRDGSTPPTAKRAARIALTLGSTAVINHQHADHAT